MTNDQNMSELELLLIEDNPHEAHLAIRNLKKHKLANHLVHIEDGEEALDFIFGRGTHARPDNQPIKPKLILLDLKLPKVNGKEILKEIKSDERTKTIPVVVLTSSNEGPDIEECYSLGANGYIVKPIDFERFSEAIADLGMYWMVLNKTPGSTQSN